MNHRRKRLGLSHSRRGLMCAVFLAATVAVPYTTSGQEVFSDGFESGDTSRWSIQIPIPDPVDGTYQFAVYDSFAFAFGGNLMIANGMVEAVNGTYFNFDKVDGGGAPECSVFFMWGGGVTLTDVGDFEFGVEFSDSYPNFGEMTWTLTFSLDDSIGFSGTLAAVGAGFTGLDSGCNGTFPTSTIKGGKTNRSTQ